MAQCGVKRGFLVLRDCGTKTNSQCANCKRPVCGEHFRARSGSGYCIECYAKDGKADADDVQSGDYAYAYRHRYYTSAHYRPIYFSTHRDHYYDDYDARGFDREDLEDVDYSDMDDAVDFEDS